MNLTPFFSPVDFESLGFKDENYDESLLISKVFFYDSVENLDLENVEIAILGIPEYRNSFCNPSTALAPDEIR
ncbi:MAG: hypothetical protein RR034_05945, partial [Bacteroidales bacterium]